MAVAIKEFRYFDHERKESVQVHVGDTVPVTVERHGVDLAKLGRTKFVDLGAEGITRAPTPVKRRKRGG